MTRTRRSTKATPMITTTQYWAIYHTLQALSYSQDVHQHPQTYGACVQCECWARIWEAGHRLLIAHEAA